MTEPGKTHDKTFLGEEVIFTGLKVTGLLMKRSVSGVKGESEALKSVNGEGEGTVDGGEGSRSNVGQRQWPVACGLASSQLAPPGAHAPRHFESTNSRKNERPCKAQRDTLPAQARRRRHPARGHNSLQ